MAIKEGLRTLLTGQSSITSLAPQQVIGKQTRHAIFVDTATQGIKPPYILISRTSVDLRGGLGATTGIRESEIDIDCFADTSPLAEAIAEAVSTFMKDYSGPAGASDTIDAVEQVSVADFQNPEVGQDVWRHAVTLTYSIFHH